jgi:hypothetical protein
MQEFRSALGCYPIESETSKPHEPQRGYRLTLFKDSASPYFFEILLPVPEMFEIFRSLTEILPATVYPILERPPEPDEDLPPWPKGRFAALGRYMPRRDVLTSFLEHAFQIQNDGMLGAGMAGRTDDTDAFREVFIDEHKTVRFITDSPKEVEAILRENRVPFIPDLVLVSERAHAHRSLVVFDDLHELFPEPDLAYDQVFKKIAVGLGLPRRHP